MIGRITGILIEKNPPSITVDVHGLGYEVDVPMSTFYNLPATGEKVSLHTHLIVREDGHFLQRARLLEEVGGAGHDRHLFLRRQPCQRGFVHIDDGVVMPADKARQHISTPVIIAASILTFN